MATVFMILRALVVINLFFFVFQIWYLTKSNFASNSSDIEVDSSVSVNIHHQQQQYQLSSSASESTANKINQKPNNDRTERETRGVQPSLRKKIENQEEHIEINEEHIEFQLSQLKDIAGNDPSSPSELNGKQQKDDEEQNFDHELQEQQENQEHLQEEVETQSEQHSVAPSHLSQPPQYTQQQPLQPHKQDSHQSEQHNQSTQHLQFHREESNHSQSVHAHQQVQNPKYSIQQFHKQEHLSSQHQPPAEVSNHNHSMANIAFSSFTPHSNSIEDLFDIKSGMLPVIKAPSSYTGKIIMDWPADTNEFGPINFKALESLLVQYPHATIRVHLIGPIEVELYKVGNLLSKYYFHKYEKLGYDISVVPMYENFTFNSVKKHMHVPLGYKYWDAEFSKCCGGSLLVSKLSSRKDIPFHLYFYRRLVALFEEGGLYTDFTWYHRQPLDIFITGNESHQSSHVSPHTQSFLSDKKKSEYHGWIMKEVCRNSATVIERSNELQKQETKCFVSTLMAFNAGSTIVSCMLQQYDSEASPLRVCLSQSDNFYSMMNERDDDADSSRKHILRPAECIDSAMSECFEKSEARNDFLYADNEHDFSSIDGTHLKSNGIMDEQFLQQYLRLHRYDNKEALAQLSKRTESNARIDCRSWWKLIHDYASQMNIPLVRRKPFRIKHVVNAAEICGQLGSSDIEADDAYFEQWYSKTISYVDARSDALLYSILENTIRSNVIWLGSKAGFSVEWGLPANGSMFDHLLNEISLRRKSSIFTNDVLYYNVTDTNRLRIDHLIPTPTAHQAMIRLPRTNVSAVTRRTLGGNFSAVAGIEREAFAMQTVEEMYLSEDPRSGQQIKVMAVKQPPCHHYKLPGNAPVPWKRQASTSCAPLFMIPGFMKAGTTALFGAIMTHPQMIYNLRGVSFKETGCYRKMHGRTERMKCFPYVQPKEHFYFGDGTVLYADLWKLASFIAEDNPDIKVIFSIRDPVKRSESHHRFVYGVLRKHGVPDMNDAIQHAMNRSEGTLMVLYDHAMAAVQEKDPILRQEKMEYMIQHFYTELPEPFDPLNEAWKNARFLITNSIYLPSIYYWYKSLPNPRNIIIVRTEEYNPRKLDIQTKLSYLRYVLDKPKEFHDFERKFEADFAVERNMTTKVSITDAEKRLNERYLIEKMNTIYRFLGVSPVDSISAYNLHETGTKKLPAEHRMNSETEQALRKFFEPFEILLSEVLDKIRGASGRTHVGD